MSDNKPAGTLPTELIDEKTFYTLGGASAAVLLTCWAINYVAVDVSWLNYKTYRLIGIILSEVFAVIIMLKKKDRKGIQWLFAFLNGLLIFVNASGLNAMTSSYIFNPADTTQTKAGFLQSSPAHNDIYRQAGIFPLPRMINWWPDEKLIEQNQVMEARIEKLDSTNIALKSLLETQPFMNKGDTSSGLRPFKNPLEDSIHSLNGQLNEKQKQLAELSALLNKTGKDCDLKLSACLREQYLYRDSILYFSGKYANCMETHAVLQNNYNALLGSLKEANDNTEAANARFKDCSIKREDLLKTLLDHQSEVSNLTERLKDCELQLAAGKPAPTLVESCRQLCAASASRLIRIPGTRGNSDDELLKQQGFMKEFCSQFRNWERAKEVKSP